MWFILNTSSERPFPNVLILKIILFGKSCWFLKKKIFVQNFFIYFCRYKFKTNVVLFQSRFPVVVKSHVCFLKKRPNPSGGGTLQWSIPYDEICYCQGVVATRLVSPSQQTCPRKDDHDAQACSDILSCNVWYLDDPIPLTQHHNWNKKHSTGC